MASIPPEGYAVLLGPQEPSELGAISTHPDISPVQDGRLELDAPVVRYWPDFGKHGKAEISVRSVLSHRAGLPALDQDLTLDEVIAWEPVIPAIEVQAPLWRPGTAHAYHP